MHDVFEEHLDEADFLWEQWERALIAPDYDLEEAAALEERLLAHLDGLGVAGAQIAESLLRPALESDAPSRLCVALWALLALPNYLTPSELLGWVKAAPEGMLIPWARALELSDYPRASEVLLPLLKESDAPRQAWALGLLSTRNELPMGEIGALLRHPTAQVAAAALQSLRPLPREVVHRELPRLLDDSRPEVRCAALEAGMFSGARVAWIACREAVESGIQVGRMPLVLLALSGDARDVERLVAYAFKDGPRQDVVWAVGFSGRVEAVEACLEWMRHTSLAALAGESFSAMTGLVLKEQYAVSVKERDESLPALEEDLKADLTLRPELVLPVPDRDSVAAWWRGAQAAFSHGIRYLKGRPFSIDGLLTELERGPMRRRFVHSMEVGVRSRGACIPHTRAFTQVQRAGMVRARALSERLSATSLPKLFGF